MCARADSHRGVLCTHINMNDTERLALLRELHTEILPQLGDDALLIAELFGLCMAIVHDNPEGKYLAHPADVLASDILRKVENHFPAGHPIYNHILTGNAAREWLGY